MNDQTIPVPALSYSTSSSSSGRDVLEMHKNVEELRATTAESAMRMTKLEGDLARMTSEVEAKAKTHEERTTKLEETIVELNETNVELNETNVELNETNVELNETNVEHGKTIRGLDARVHRLENSVESLVCDGLGHLIPAALMDYIMLSFKVKKNADPTQSKKSDENQGPVVLEDIREAVKGCPNPALQMVAALKDEFEKSPVTVIANREDLNLEGDGRFIGDVLSLVTKDFNSNDRANYAHLKDPTALLSACLLYYRTASKSERRSQKDKNRAIRWVKLAMNTMGKKRTTEILMGFIEEPGLGQYQPMDDDDLNPFSELFHPSIVLPNMD